MKHLRSDTVYLLIVYVLLFLVWMILINTRAHAQSNEIQQEIVSSAIHHHVDPDLALAIAEVESQFNENAVGSLGEIGVFQLRPEFHRVVSGATRQNIDAGTNYLARLQRECQSYGDAFFICFNYGTARKIKYPHRFPYYLRVMEVLRRQREIQYANSDENKARTTP